MDELVKDLGVIAIEVVTLMAITAIACEVIRGIFETIREWIRTRESK